MPEPVTPGDRRPDRTPAERSADHAAIDRLSTELLPALIAKLGATGLGELEVREGGWRVRLRRPGETGGSSGARERRPGERERAARSGAGQAGSHAPTGLTPVGPGHDVRDGVAAAAARDARNGTGREGGRIVATSPAVGVFQPRSEARAGTKVRAGDRLGSVEVVAPSDGVVGASLVEPGDAVEYGQELILIEFASTAVPEA